MNSTQSKLALRPVVTDADLQTYINFKAELRPDRISSLEDTKKEDATMPEGVYFKRYFVTDDEQPIAGITFMQMYWTPDKELFELWMTLPKDLSIEEANFAVKEGLAHLESIGAKRVNSWVPTEFPNLINALESAGFTFDQANPESILNLEELDLTPFDSAIESLLASDLRVLSLAELLEEDPENGMARYHELDIRLTQDVPLPWEFTGEPLESFEKGFRVHSESFPTIQVVADGDHLVATSMLFVNKMDKRFYGTGLTGVDRNYRRRGIAKALKAINFKLAKERGGTQITCDNEENNPMLQLNYQLGFKPYWVWNSYTKVLE